MATKSVYRSIDLVNSVSKLISTNQLIRSKDRLLLATSGGQDSICLLVVLSQLTFQMSLHLSLFWCHHLWQIDSFLLMREMAKVSFLFQMDSCFVITSKPVHSELLARNWRHDCSSRISLFYNYHKVTLAHSGSDRVETILLNLMRGTGTTGLSPLRQTKTISENFLKKTKHISQFPHSSFFCWSSIFVAEGKIKENVDLSSFAVQSWRSTRIEEAEVLLRATVPCGSQPVRAVNSASLESIQFSVNICQVTISKNNNLLVLPIKFKSNSINYVNKCNSIKTPNKKWFHRISAAFSKKCHSALEQTQLHKNLFYPNSCAPLMQDIATVDSIDSCGSNLTIAPKNNICGSSTTETKKHDYDKSFQSGKFVPKKSGIFVRPLMSLNRFEIGKMCLFWKLPVYPDKSNQKVNFLRNRVRKQLLPTIKIFFNPRIENVLLQFAEIAVAENDYMNQIANKVLKKFLSSFYFRIGVTTLVPSKGFIPEVNAMPIQSSALSTKSSLLRAGLALQGGLKTIDCAHFVSNVTRLTKLIAPANRLTAATSMAKDWSHPLATRTASAKLEFYQFFWQELAKERSKSTESISVSTPLTWSMTSSVQSADLLSAPSRAVTRRALQQSDALARSRGLIAPLLRTRYVTAVSTKSSQCAARGTGRLTELTKTNSRPISCPRALSTSLTQPGFQRIFAKKSISCESSEVLFTQKVDNAKSKKTKGKFPFFMKRICLTSRITNSILHFATPADDISESNCNLLRHSESQLFARGLQRCLAEEKFDVIFTDNLIIHLNRFKIGTYSPFVISSLPLALQRRVAMLFLTNYLSGEIHYSQIENFLAIIKKGSS